jgi:hypothetical protein
MDVTREQLLSDTSAKTRHVVIIGAGASRASFPSGDANGNKLPLMSDFVETLQLQDLIDETGLEFPVNNFESIYSTLYKDKKLFNIQQKIESRISEYFSSLKLPEAPTLYDYLVLSLRSKDVIASFNWDPLLVQARQRNHGIANLPRLIFLHGNVSIGYCLIDRTAGLRGTACSQCNKQFEPSRLLYPIDQKNYHLDPFIDAQWIELQSDMKNASMFTVFGYSAPTSDVSAIELLKDGWGNSKDRNMEEIEFINIQAERTLIETWRDFVHTHHYSYSNDFFDSWIAKYPRRSIEAFAHMNYEANFVEDNPLPKFDELNKLKKWIQNLTQFE